jgi:non-ribosomal peptide synthetase component F/acyl carrier protein
MELASRLLSCLQKNREKIALFDSYQKVSYEVLLKKASIVAKYLLEKGVKQDSIVFIEGSNNIDTIFLIVGTILSGAAFSVIPDDYPKERKMYMSKLVSPFITLNDRDILKYKPMQLASMEVKRNENSLLYIIFTSGTTGKPKAVAIEDKNIPKIIENKLLYKGNVIAHLAPLQFDASMYEILGGLMNGMTIRVLNKSEILDLKQVKNFLPQIDTIFLTTALFNLYVDECPDELKKVKLILTGGEKASIYHMRKIAPYTSLYNMYGPTETTIFATAYHVQGQENEVPIGSMFEGEYKILSKTKDVREGELIISDTGVMRGYYKDVNKSQEVLLNVDGKVFYKTGDLVKVDENKQLVYVDRIGRQVKILGYRVELDEVERMAHNCGLKKHCVALKYKNKLGLVITEKFSDVELKRLMNQKVPSYIVPKIIKQIDSIPMTPNGKTDLSKLEEKLILQDMFDHALGNRNIDFERSFFENGGDSLAALKLIWLLNEKGKELDFDGLNSTTVGELLKELIE